LAKEKSKKKSEFQKVLKAYDQAMKVFRKGDNVKALELMKAFIEKYSSEKEIVDRARIYQTICEARLKKEKINLKTFEDYYQYGVYKVNQGDFEEALKVLDKARQMKPKEAKILYLMADAYCLMEEKEECLANLKKAIQMDKYFSILAQNESDFESLREDKKFKLITRMT
jgi:tetratricopeptide (TPR) repeat protein